MSIDARIAGIRKISTEDEIKLNLEDRPDGGLAGQQTLRILNTDQIKKTKGWLLVLRKLIGMDIWGGAGDIMLGDTLLAKRDGYTGIIMVDNWVDVIQDESEGGE